MLKFLVAKEEGKHVAVSYTSPDHQHTLFRRNLHSGMLDLWVNVLDNRDARLTNITSIRVLWVSVFFNSTSQRKTRL